MTATILQIDPQNDPYSDQQQNPPSGSSNSPFNSPFNRSSNRSSVGSASNSRQNIRYALAEASSTSLMIGLGETYIPAFVLSVGLAESSAGLIVSIPVLAGAFLQLVSPALIKITGSHKKWVMACATGQALVFLVLAGAALSGNLGTIAAFSLASLYWACGMGANVGWYTWITTLLPMRFQTQFMARRSRLIQIGTMIGFLGAGLALHAADTIDLTANQKSAGKLHMFAAIFCLACLARIYAIWVFKRHQEPTPLPSDQQVVPVPKLLMRLRSTQDGRLITYLIAAQAAVQVAVPFFTPFMLMKMNLNYGVYTALVTTAFVSRILSLPTLGRFAKRFGANRLLLICGIAMAPMALFWALAWHSLPLLFFIQAASGIVWGGFDLASSLLIFERISQKERTSVLTTYNLIGACAMVVGSLIGGSVLEWFSESLNGYLVIFTLSSLLRAATIVLLLPAVASATPRITRKKLLPSALTPPHPGDIGPMAS